MERNLYRTKDFGKIMSDAEEWTIGNKVYQLVSLGLTPLQARVFLALLENGEASASVVTKIVGADRSDTYRALGTLKRLGLVEVALSNPMLFSTVSPERAIDILLELKTSEVRSLSEQRDEIVGWLQSIRNHYESLPHNQLPRESSFKLFTGRQVFTRMYDAIARTQVEILKIFAGFTLQWHLHELAGLEQTLIKHGVSTRFISEINIGNLAAAEEYSRIANIRHRANLDFSLRYTIIDSSQVFLASYPHTDTLRDQSALWTNNAVLVNACKQNFEEVWSQSIGSSQVIENLKKDSMKLRSTVQE